MKKIICIFLVIVLLIVFIRNIYSEYTVKYKVNEFEVVTHYKDKRFYFEIKKDYVFNFDIYKKRNIRRTYIEDIEVIKGKDYTCIYPKINNIDTYPLCYKNGKSISFYLINDEKLDSYKYLKEDKIIYNKEKEFEFYNNLSEKDFIALWTYSGFYYMNESNAEFISLFENDKYDNSLCILFNDKILLPNYNEKHIFTSFVLFDIKNGKKKRIETKFEIDYDSYIAGTFKNNVYLFDNKNLNLYEIDTKKERVKLVGSEDLGYIKIKNNQKAMANKNEYKKERITFFETLKNNYKYEIKKGIYRIINENDQIKTLIYDKEDIKIIKETKDKLYFIKNDSLYLFSPDKGVRLILHYFELNFNSENMIYIYNE